MIRHSFFLLAFTISSLFAGDDEGRLAELDAYWAEVSKAVREGNFEAYLIKKDRWLILMENQKSEGTAEEWQKLAASPRSSE